MKTKIIYEDEHILVVYKPAGIAVQAAKPMEMDVVSELKNYLKGSYIGLVHRLDQPVEGILVFGKTTFAAAVLSRQSGDRIMKKEYLAAVLSKGEIQPQAVLTDYLLKDGRSNTSRPVEPSVKNAKKAVLTYEVEKTVLLKEILGKGELQNSTTEEFSERADAEKVALLKVRLETGRHHQIRVQLANANLPLLGDLKYGSVACKNISALLGVKDVALCAKRLVFKHPKTGKTMEFHVSPQKEILHYFTV